MLHESLVDDSAGVELTLSTMFGCAKPAMAPARPRKAVVSAPVPDLTPALAPAPALTPAPVLKPAPVPTCKRGRENAADGSDGATEPALRKALEPSTSSTAKLTHVDVTQNEFGPKRVKDVACSAVVQNSTLQWLQRRFETPQCEPKTILVLQGPSGCGKLALARALAAEVNAECIEGSGSSAERGELHEMVHVCERELMSRALPASLFEPAPDSVVVAPATAPVPVPPPPRAPTRKVFVFCRVDGMMTMPKTDMALMLRLLKAANQTRAAPLILTLQDCVCDALRTLRAHSRVLLVRMDQPPPALAERAIARIAALRSWPRGAVTTAMRAYSGDLRHALIDAQEVALGQRRIFTVDTPTRTPFDVARRLLNSAAPMEVGALTNFCGAGYVDTVALRCVFSGQYVCVRQSSMDSAPLLARPHAWPQRRIAPRLAVLETDGEVPVRAHPRARITKQHIPLLAATAEAWSWYDATVPWNSLLCDELLAVPLAAVQRMRTADKIEPFEGMFNMRKDGGENKNKRQRFEDVDMRSFGASRFEL